MNSLQGITKQDAELMIKDLFGEEVHIRYYYSWPQMFSSTAGPFHKPGMFSGQAFTQFQMECWSDGKHALVFSQGKVVKTIICEEPFSVDWYTNLRSSWG